MHTAWPFFTPEAFGIYFPPVLIWAAVALAPYLLLRWGLARAGFYRFVWHRPLFDAALYIILFGMFILLLPSLLEVLR
ncbi:MULTISPECIES: DUF1656 domain-containing protein [Ancylobacter]|uniref:DUF1656 domain-containing protein n=1 Tax=Ancylobacter polymorphus TaxID=223390 RepID=A0A9E7A2F7_9HYPH|nr:DUF1656 domain-containing protein [Ancylobacter polymorphus]UOK71950.1 DUF1656 domain-containing protein [Ancylobacter polymorphus]